MARTFSEFPIANREEAIRNLNRKLAGKRIVFNTQESSMAFDQLIREGGQTVKKQLSQAAATTTALRAAGIEDVGELIGVRKQLGLDEPIKFTGISTPGFFPGATTTFKDTVKEIERKKGLTPSEAFKELIESPPKPFVPLKKTSIIDTLKTTIKNIVDPKVEVGVPIFTQAEVDKAKASKLLRGETLPDTYIIAGEKAGEEKYVEKQDFVKSIQGKTYGQLLKESPPSIIHKFFLDTLGTTYVKFIDKKTSKVLGTRKMTDAEVKKWGATFGTIFMGAFFSPAFQTGAKKVTQKQVQKEVSKTKFDKLGDFYNTVKRDLAKKGAGDSQIKYLNDLAKKINKNDPKAVKGFTDLVKDLYNKGIFKGFPQKFYTPSPSQPKYKLIVEILGNIPSMKGAGVVVGAVSSATQKTTPKIIIPKTTITKPKQATDIVKKAIKDLEEAKNQSQKTNQAVTKVQTQKTKQSVVKATTEIQKNNQAVATAQVQEQKTKQALATAQTQVQKTKQALATAQVQKTKQKTIQKTKQVQKQVNKLKEKLKNKQKIVTIFKSGLKRMEKTKGKAKKKIRLIPLPKIKLKRVPTKKKGKKANSYHVYAKPLYGKKLVKVTKKPISKKRAEDLRNVLIDQSLSRQGKIKGSVSKPSKAHLKAPLGYSKRTRHKFRKYKVRKGKRIPLKHGKVIEKRKYFSDVASERKRLTLLKKIAQMQRIASRKRTPIKRRVAVRKKLTNVSKRRRTNTRIAKRVKLRRSVGRIKAKRRKFTKRRVKRRIIRRKPIKRRVIRRKPIRRKVVRRKPIRRKKPVRRRKRIKGLIDYF